MSIADIIAVMNNGRIEDVGPPERVYMKPRTRFTATFMGESNMFEGEVIKCTTAEIEVATALGSFRIPGTAQSGADVQLSIRPEQILVQPADSSRLVALGKLKVDEVAFFGTHHRCLGRHATTDLPLIVRLPPNHPIQAGQELAVSVLQNDIVLLDR
jgi:spermidine/putrescine transport system ATP-binding protein